MKPEPTKGVKGFPREPEAKRNTVDRIIQVRKRLRSIQRAFQKKPGSLAAIQRLEAERKELRIELLEAPADVVEEGTEQWIAQVKERARVTARGRRERYRQLAP